MTMAATRLVEGVHLVVVYYCWWSLFYALAPMIWFYPLNELDITGYESFAAVWLIPIITLIPLVRRTIESSIGVCILEIGMFAGILSFQMTSTLRRLMVLSLGNGAAILYFCSRLFSGSKEAKWRHLWLLLATNLLFLSSRIPTTSLAPPWTSHELNLVIATILFLSIFTRIAVASRSTGDSKTSSLLEILLNLRRFEAESRSKIVESTPGSSPGCLRQLSTGIALGSLLYLSHWIFGDLHVLSRWVVTGYPNPGPSAFISAPFVLFALICGLILPSLLPKLCSSIYLWMLGTLSFFCTYYLDGWFGFISGLFLAVYVSVLWILLGSKLIDCTSAGLVVTSGMIIYLCEIFFHVWTVAYNFVPGGVYTREHSDYLIGFLCLTFLTTVRNCPSLHIPKFVKVIVFISVLVTASGMLYRLPFQPEIGKKLNPVTSDFTALIWTFHFGYDNKGWPSLERAADLLNRTNADVIALLESDASKPYLGHNDLGMWLSERLGMFVDFGPSTKDHTWGNLLLSKYPIISSTHHLLPSPLGELAPAISATLNISGNLVDIVSTHMGNDQDSLDRKLQTEYLARITSASKNSVVFLGYVTSAPGSRDYLHYTNQGGLKDIDDTDKHRWCEYIMYKNLIREGYARISHGGLSDTEVQMARFVIPENLKLYKDNDLVETDVTKLGSLKRFSESFGEFTSGHFLPPRHNFHMSTPKYFLRASGA